MTFGDPHAEIFNVNGMCLAKGTFTGKGWLLDMIACKATMHVVKLVEQRSGLTGEMVLVPVKDPGIGVIGVAMMAGADETQPIEVWHMRLGHLNQRSIQQLVTRAEGMHIGPPRAQTVSMRCEPCLRGAQYCSVLYSRSNPVSRALEHIWSDVKGPLLDKDVYGFHHFVTFIDKFTQWTVGFPILGKSDVFNAFKLFEARAERVKDCKILNFHCNGGGEYLTNEF